MKLSPATEAVAYRVWAYANPLGWDCTFADAANAIGEPPMRVRSVITLKGWTHRFRRPPSASTQSFEGAYAAASKGGLAYIESKEGTDEVLEELRFDEDA